MTVRIGGTNARCPSCSLTYRRSLPKVYPELRALHPATCFYDFQARYSPVIAWLINTDDGFGLNWHIMMHLNPLVLRLKEKCKNTIHEEQSSRIDLNIITSTSIFSQQCRLTIKRNGYENWRNNRQGVGKCFDLLSNSLDEFFKKYMEITFNKQDNFASAVKFSYIRQRKRVRSIEMKFARSWIHFTSNPLLLYIAVVVA